MKFSEFVTKLTAVPDTEKDKDAVEVIHSVTAAEVFQPIFDRGHSVGLTKGTGKTTEAETRATTAEGRAAEAERQLNEFKIKHPEAAKLQEQYQSDLQKKDQEHAEEIRKRDALIETERRDRATNDLVLDLVSLHKVDRDYAQVLAAKPENQARIKFNDKGEREVLQRGKDIAIVPTAEKGAIGMFADELQAAVPAKFKGSDAGGGGGLQEERGGGGSGNKTIFDKTREAETKRQEQDKKRTTTTAAERFGSSIAR